MDQLPADVMLKLYYTMVYFNQRMLYSVACGKSRRINASKIDYAHRRACKLLADDNKKILTFHSIYDYFALLMAFNTNNLSFQEYFKDNIFSSTISYAQHKTQNKYQV